MGRIVKFNVVDDAGKGVAGQSLVVGDVELKTGATGLAQALLDDGETSIVINGVLAYRGPVEALKPTEVLTRQGVRQS